MLTRSGEKKSPIWIGTTEWATCEVLPAEAERLEVQISLEPAEFATDEVAYVTRKFSKGATPKTPDSCVRLCRRARHGIAGQRPRQYPPKPQQAETR